MLNIYNSYAQMQKVVNAGCKFTTHANLDVSQWQTVTNDTLINITTNDVPYWSKFNPVLENFDGFEEFRILVGFRQWPYKAPDTIQKIPFIGIMCNNDFTPKFYTEVPERFNKIPVINIITDTASLFGPKGIYNDGDGFPPIDAGAIFNYTKIDSSKGFICVDITDQVIGSVTLCFDKETRKATIKDVEIILLKINQNQIAVGVENMSIPYTPNYFAKIDIATKLMGYPRERIEKKTYLSLITPNKSINLPARLIVSGNYGSLNAQKGLQIFFKDKKLKAENLFNRNKQYEYRRLVLRAGGSLHIMGRLNHTYSNRIAINAGLHAPSDCATHLFLNGEYWGIYNLEERMSDHSYKYLTGSGSDSIILLKYEGEFANYLLTKANIAGFDTSGVGHITASNLDVKDFMTYIFHHTFLSNTDWHDKTRNRLPLYIPSKNKLDHMVIDQDNAFSIGITEFYDSLLYNTNGDKMAQFFLASISTEEGLIFHLNHSCDLMNTAYHKEVMLPIINNAYNEYAPLIKTFNVERWGVHSVTSDELDKQYRQVVDFVTNRDQSYRNLLLKNYKRKISGEAHVTINIPSDTLAGKINESGGYVKLSTLTLKENFNGIYFKGIPLPIEAVANQGFTFSHWLETGSTSPKLNIILKNDTVLTPIFKAVNNNKSLQPPTSEN
jgi:hypothetical protein